jgi:hypothetical protein
MVYDWLFLESDQLRSSSPLKIRREAMTGGWEIVFPGWSEGITERPGNVVSFQERLGIILEPSGGSRNEKGEGGCEQWSRSLVLLFVDAHSQAISWLKKVSE